MRFALKDAAQEVSNYLGASGNATSIIGFLFITADDRYIFVFRDDSGKPALLDFEQAEPIVAQVTKKKERYH